jgi:predicted nucleic acid-binding Zn ribbon protein
VPGHAAAASRRSGLSVESISGVLPALLRRLGLETGIMGWRAVREWPDAVGPGLARRTRAVSFHEGTLLVEVEGSAWLHELNVLKRDLLRQLNRRLGAELVRDLSFINNARGGNRR